jgi:hypothetical protein
MLPLSIGCFVINCCYAARGIGVSSTTTKTVDCPDLTFSDIHTNVADWKISLNVNRRVARPACIAGVFTFCRALRGWQAEIQGWAGINTPQMALGRVFGECQATLERQMVFVAFHLNGVLMLAGLREIVGRLQSQPVVGIRPTGFL